MEKNIIIEKNMIAIRYSRMFRFNFDLSNNVDENLKCKTGTNEPHKSALD